MPGGDGLRGASAHRWPALGMLLVAARRGGSSDQPCAMGGGGMSATSGNNFAVNPTTKAVTQYKPPGVVALGSAASVGAQQTIAGGDNLPAGSWKLVSGTLTADGDVVVQPITGV